MTEKERFCKKVTVLIDTREKKNQHILQELQRMGVQTEQRKLDFCDYSFVADGRDFSLSCVIERKANVDELWGNLTRERARFEKELETASKQAAHVAILLEGVNSEQELRAYQIPERQMELQGRKVAEIGEFVHCNLQAFASGNRYGIHIHYTKKENSAKKILEIFYYFWRAYKNNVRLIR
jgi:ERCC4-type nuclease